jgi:hypothetical protein
VEFQVRWGVPTIEALAADRYTACRDFGRVAGDKSRGTLDRTQGVVTISSWWAEYPKAGSIPPPRLAYR